MNAIGASHREMSKPTAAKARLSTSPLGFVYEAGNDG
jgi:hypothetical protein